MQPFKNKEGNYARFDYCESSYDTGLISSPQFLATDFPSDDKAYNIKTIPTHAWS